MKARRLRNDPLIDSYQWATNSRLTANLSYGGARNSFLESAALQRGRCAISCIHPNAPRHEPLTSSVGQVNHGQALLGGRLPRECAANRVSNVTVPGSWHISDFELKRSNHKNMNQTRKQLSPYCAAAKGNFCQLQLQLCAVLLAAAAVAAPAPAAAGKEKQGGHASKAQPEWPAGINRCFP